MKHIFSRKGDDYFNLLGSDSPLLAAKSSKLRLRKYPAAYCGDFYFVRYGLILIKQAEIMPVTQHTGSGFTHKPYMHRRGVAHHVRDRRSFLYVVEQICYFLV